MNHTMKLNKAQFLALLNSMGISVPRTSSGKVHMGKMGSIIHQIRRRGFGIKWNEACDWFNRRDKVNLHDYNY